jgi:hypothetical protein
MNNKVKKKKQVSCVSPARTAIRQIYESGTVAGIENAIKEYAEKNKVTDRDLPAAVTVRRWAAADNWDKKKHVEKIRERIRERIITEIVNRQMDLTIVDKLDDLLSDPTDKVALKNGISELCKILDVYPQNDKQSVEVQVNNKIELRLEDFARGLIPIILQYVDENKRLDCVNAIEAKYEEIKK